MRNLLYVACAILVGCASQPDEIQTAYVSPVQYQNFDCQQIQQEMQRVSYRATELHSSLKSKADADAAQMGVGLVLFWPALFFLEGGDGAEAHEYARMKGEKEALEKLSIAKKCGVGFTTVSSSDSESGFQVSRVQTELKARGYDPGPVNGQMHELTRKALKQYQTQAGLEPSGTLDDETLRSLDIEP